MHDDQIALTAVQVGMLINDQLPSLQDKEIVRIDGGGTVNAIFRVGDVSARFPLRPSEGSRARLESEAVAAEEFRVASGVACPLPVLVGEPGHGYPVSWSAQSWVDGDVATPVSHRESLALARDLAELIRRLRRHDAAGRRFHGPGRGGVLTDHDDWVEHCIRQSEGLMDTQGMRSLWAGLRTLPREDPDTFSHTDLIPGNILTRGDRLAGLLDTGGSQPADPALDLVCAWHLFDSPARDVFRGALECDDLQWARGRAWAFEQAAGLGWYYRRTNPGMAELGFSTLRRLMDPC